MKWVFNVLDYIQLSERDSFYITHSNFPTTSKKSTEELTHCESPPGPESPTPATGPWAAAIMVKAPQWTLPPQAHLWLCLFQISIYASLCVCMYLFYWWKKKWGSEQWTDLPKIRWADPEKDWDSSSPWFYNLFFSYRTLVSNNSFHKAHYILIHSLDKHDCGPTRLQNWSKNWGSKRL